MIFNENEKVVLECDLKVWNEKKLDSLAKLLNQEFIQVVIINHYDLDENLLVKMIKNYPSTHFYTPICFNCRNHSTYKSVDISDLGDINVITDLSLGIKINLNGTFDIDYMESIDLSSTNIFLEFYTEFNKFDAKNYLYILDMLQQSKYRIYLSSLFKYSNILKKHPCNMYLCSNNLCHSKKSSVPRYLYWYDDSLYPYKVNLDELRVIKESEFDDFENYISEHYLLSDAHRYFIDLNKMIFKKYIMNNHILILPWNILLLEAIHYL